MAGVTRCSREVPTSMTTRQRRTISPCSPPPRGSARSSRRSNGPDRPQKSKDLLRASCLALLPKTTRRATGPEEDQEGHGALAHPGRPRELDTGSPSSRDGTTASAPATTPTKHRHPGAHVPARSSHRGFWITARARWSCSTCSSAPSRTPQQGPDPDSFLSQVLRDAPVFRCRGGSSASPCSPQTKFVADLAAFPDPISAVPTHRLQSDHR